MKRILTEALGVAILGMLIGFLANALSPKGIALARNYFPPTPTPAPLSPSNTNSLAGTQSSATNSAARLRLEALGIQMVDSNFVAQAFQDPARLQHRLIFVDARESNYYQQGHVPGAYQLDYYRPEAYLPALLPAASAAETIVIYCNGGDCEDSELAARFLKDAGIPPGKLRVYVGGFGEWVAGGLPVEMGAQNSGVLKAK